MGLCSFFFGRRNHKVEEVSTEEEQELFISLGYMEEVSGHLEEDVLAGFDGVLLGLIGLDGLEHILELMHDLSDLSGGLVPRPMRLEVNRALAELALRPRPRILGNREGIYIRRWRLRKGLESALDPTLGVRNPAALAALKWVATPKVSKVKF